MDSHSSKHLYDENPFRILLIVIRTNMYMTKTHKKMDSHSYKDVHDENPYKKMVNMDIQSKKIVRDKTYNRVNFNS